MELFIRADDIFMEIHKVSLKEGHIPMIGDHLPGFLNENMYGYCNSSQIEPAVWFKVTVVDSISIDCSKRSIIWNSDSALPEKVHDSDSEGENSIEKTGQKEGLKRQGRRRKVSESMYIGGEFYGFDSDLDDLFETLQQAVLNFASSMITREAFNEIVMRMLHCHVLPVIKLTAEDIPRMTQILASQEAFIQQVDEEIILKNKQADQVMSAMERQREKFIKDFIRVSNGKSTLTHAGKHCPSKFAEVLLSDVEGDITTLYEKLDNLQKEVEDAKIASSHSCSKHGDSMASGPDVDYCKILQEKRLERDCCHQEYEKLLHARENLRVFVIESKRISHNLSFRESFLKSFKSHQEPPTDPIHNVYLGIANKLADVKDEARLLVQKKVMIISVKEAIRHTLQELKQHQESLGYEISRPYGPRPTDVLRRSSKPREWLTLSERVAQLVEDGNKWIHNEHTTFCKQVTDRCKAAVFEKKLVDVSHNAIRTGSTGESPLVMSGDSSKTNSGVYVENKLFCLKNLESIVTLQNEPGTDAKEMTDCEKVLKESQDGSCRNSCQSDISDGSSERLGHSQSSSGYNSQVESSNVHSDLLLQSPPCGDSLVQLEGQIGDDDFVIVHNTDRDFLRKTIEELKPKIHSHFQSVCSWLGQELGNSSHVAARKIWLCYEYHFFELVMAPLMSLYEAAFAQIIERLRARIPDLTVEDLDLEGTMIANMLQEKHDLVFNKPGGATVDQVNVETESTAEIVKLDVDRQSVTEGKESKEKKRFKVLEVKIAEAAPRITVDEEPSGMSDTQLEDVFKDLPVAPTASLSVATMEHNSSTAFRERSRSNPSQDQRHYPMGFPCQYSPRGEEKSKLRRIKIYYPVSVTVVYSRRTWPPPKLPDIAEHTEDVEFGEEAFKLNKTKTNLELQDDEQNSSTVRRKLFHSSGIESNDGAPTVGVQRDIRLKPQYLDRFATAIECLEEAIKSTVPLTKIQYLTRCIREISNQISKYQREDLDTCDTCGACADDLIDMLIILLLNCDLEITANLYPQLMFLTDVLPSFFEGGPYEFCLIQFSGAFQFIQDRLLMLNHSRD